MELGELIGVVCGERGKRGARALLASTVFILFSPSDWNISSASVSFWDFLAVYKMNPSIIGANVPISKVNGVQYCMILSIILYVFKKL